MPNRNRSRAWFFTKNKANVGMVAQFCNSFESENLEYVFQLEYTENNPHFQGVVRYKNPRDTWPNIDAHWERCRNWRKAIKYCTKLDTRTDGPWTNIQNLKFRKTLIDPLRGVELYDWQKFLKNLILKTEPEFRQIYWFWEPNGRAGKTSFAKHMKILMGNDLLYTSGLSRDILCAFAKLCETRDVKCVIFGLTRQDMNKCSYRSLEIFGDGIGFSGKYESGDLNFNPPHVICFANFPPDCEKVSEDRWNIRKL